jgi:vesicular inhibitory amino acid transporter
MMPLRLLSIPSLLSTLSTFLLLLIILIDGLSKASPPGSLRYPAETSWSPEWERANWLGGVGLVLAGFGGHAVVPSLARDMKHPENFDKVGERGSGSEKWRIPQLTR